MPSRVLVALRIKAESQRVFDAFTREIDLWWRRNLLFSFVEGKTGRLAFEPREGGSFTETYEDGEVFEIGRISVWQPPERLVFTWRPASFAPEQTTEVQVSFEAVGEETRVTVEHVGWDVVPRTHAAKHNFPDDVFLLRLAEWWRSLLGGVGSRAAGSS